MKILIHVNHPAHYHLFKNPAKILTEQENEIFWLARKKDILTDLMKDDNINFLTISKAATTKLSGLFEIILTDWKIYKFVKKNNIDLMLGTSIAIAHVGKITKAKSIVFEEDDEEYIKAFVRLTYPFADYILTPDCMPENHGKKHIKYPSYHELAYLHPKYFTPNPQTLKLFNIREEEKFFIIRLVALKAFHDSNISGINYEMQKKLISKLLRHGKIIISCEGELYDEWKQFQYKISPNLIHDLLYYSTMVISDSQTMTAEAAILGTPSIRINSFAHKISYLVELEDKYGLTYSYLPKDFSKALDKIEEILQEDNPKEIYYQKLNNLLIDKIPLANWVAQFINKNFNYDKLGQIMEKQIK